MKFLLVVLLGLFTIVCSRPNDADSEEGYTNDEEKEEVNFQAPVFTTEPLNLDVKQGETIILPCEGKHFVDYVLLWKKEGNVVTTGSHLLLDNNGRYSLDEATGALTVKRVNLQDSGRYTCSVSTGQTGSPEITHNIRVLAPPRIEAFQDNIVVKQGDSATLVCNVTGNPQPTVTWSRRAKHMVNGDKKTEGNAISFEKVNRHYSGTYECSADNGIGDGAKALINLLVQYNPEVESVRESIHTTTGRNEDLTCIVHAEPKAIVTWSKDNKPLDESRYLVKKTDSHHYTVHIENVQQSDIGTYTCQAQNDLGTTLKVITLSGAPKQAEFKDGIPGTDHKSHTLIWVVDSFTPITEYKLRYRKLGSSSSWEEVQITVKLQDGLQNPTTHTLHNLSPSTHYEASVQSKNDFDWSKESQVYQFYTNGKDYQSAEAEPLPGHPEPEAGSIGTSDTSDARSILSSYHTLFTALSTLIYCLILHP